MIRITSAEKNIFTGEPIPESELFFHGKLATYHVGEITKVDCLDVSFENYNGTSFYDSKGVAFIVTMKPRSYRRAGRVVIAIPEERRDLLPDEYKDVNEVVCSDPRVIWYGIVAMWLRSPQDREHVGAKVWYQILSDIIPPYDEAIELLKKNGFPPFVSDKKTMDELFRGEDRAYYNDWSALKYPPVIDWNKYRE